MKKLAIMFVMLLGSVATMQAQSFSFACSSAMAEGFSPAQTQDLVASGFDLEIQEEGHSLFRTAQAYWPVYAQGSYLIINGNYLFRLGSAFIEYEPGQIFDGQDDSGAQIPYDYRLVYGPNTAPIKVHSNNLAELTALAMTKVAEAAELYDARPISN